MEELSGQFLVEGRELVQAASDDLAAMADRPDSPDLIDAVFRAIHTLKGATGLFDLQPLGEMLHAAEDLLGALRRKTILPSAELVRTLLEAVDQTSRWLDAFEAEGSLPADAAAVGRRLQKDLRRPLDQPGHVDDAEEPSGDQAWVQALVDAQQPAEQDGLIAIRYVPRADCFFAGDDPIAILKSVPGLGALSIGPREPWGPIEAFEPFRCNLILEALATGPRAEIQAALRLVADQVEIVDVPASSRGAPSSVEAVPDVASKTLRIDVDSIDALATIADEIVIANNALAHLASQARGGLAGEALIQGLAASHQALDRLSGALHRAVTRARLVPLSSLFRRFPRLMREIAAKLGKDLDLAVEGGTIEVDKSLVDGLFEPLLHLLRNAADHGIEPPAARRQAGKPPRGRIALRATRDGGQVAIEIADDGRGIDPARLRHAVRARGLMPEAALAALSDQEAMDLIFLPGFSTAETVTDLSGRGVGMDAVRASILRLGGRIAVASAEGTGTTVRLSLPESIVLSGVVVVTCAGQNYGVPMDVVAETVRIPPGGVIPVRNGRAFVLRDTVVPLVDLSSLLGFGPAATQGDLRLLIVRHQGGAVAVAVDELADRMNLLLRPTSGLLVGIPGIAGTAVLGDGRVLMILNLPGLIG
jgi:two-component system chemotaxis sensor kinase CheA